MKFLAWDTSTKRGCITGFDSEEILFESYADMEATHSERLLLVIDNALENLGWKLSDVDAFGIGLGPGSFTGLRIGMTAARTLAHSLEKPLYGVSSLAILAHSNQVAGAETVVLRDAFRGKVFARVQDWEGVFEPAELLEKLLSTPCSRFVFTGEEPHRWETEFSRLSTVEFRSSELRAESLAVLLREEESRANGQPLKIFPNYLRASSAEEKRN